MHKSLIATLATAAWCLGIATSGCGAPSAGALEVLNPAKAQADGDTRWYNFKRLDLEGRGWTNTKVFFDRLPAKTKLAVRRKLSRQSAGLCARFVTNATTISVRWTLTSPTLSMPHMAATGVSGVDLYVKLDGRWRWLACGEPTAQKNNVQLVQGMPAGQREYLLYLPLYNGVSAVDIGIPAENLLAKGPPRDELHSKPIVFYGTSITQGSCASRPGMAHTAILGRRFDRPVINLGFAGHGVMDPEIAELMGELDAAVYVIDCLPNMTAEKVASRTEPLVAALRKAHPSTPIVLVEDRTYSNAFLIDAKHELNMANRAALQGAFQELQASGVENLYYIAGADLLGDDGEGTVDGSHPSDLGFMRQADAFSEVLEPILRSGRIAANPQPAIALPLSSTLPAQ